MFKSALIKLTLWYVGLIMALSLSFSVVLYHYSALELNEGLEQQFNELNIIDHGTDDALAITHAEYHDRVSHLLLIFVYFNLIVLGLSSTLSYFLAKLSLRPIEQTHRAQSRFTAQASHELRTPLTAMRADTESVLLNSIDDQPLLVKTLRANLRDLKRLESLTNHLLELAKYRSDRTIAKQKFELKLVMRRVIKQAKRSKYAKNRIIKLNAQPIAIIGDPLAIQLVLTTILDNAIKYSDFNSIIQLSLENTDKNATITIKDSGFGIDQIDLPYVFDPFYRSATILNQTSNGYGLGLSLAKQIVESHRGKIIINSVKEQGTEVKIELPINN